MEKKHFSGFTLIEMMVVFAIIGVITAILLVSFGGARKSARDATRKADLETIRAGLELYKADCGVYPASLPQPGSPLKGTGTPPSCNTNNVYISSMPADPISTQKYYYQWVTNYSYKLCTALELGTVSAVCGGGVNCGAACNYEVVNP